MQLECNSSCMVAGSIDESGEDVPLVDLGLLQLKDGTCYPGTPLGVYK